MTQTPAPLRIIIPACDEALRIVPVLRSYCSYFQSRATILVVANGCVDDTAALVRELQAEFGNLELLEIRGRVGKGCAVRAGFVTGEEPFVGFTDADGSTAPEEFDKLLGAAKALGADGAIGSRWLPGSRIRYAQGILRRAVSRVFNLMTRALFGLRFADTQCGSKVFRRSALSAIIDSLEHAGFAFDVELLWLLKQLGCRIVEFPIAWDDREGSKVHLVRTSSSMLSAVLRLRLRNSWIWRMRVAAGLAQEACVPVRSSRRLLLLGSDPSSTGTLAALFERAGFVPVHAREELAAWHPALNGLGDGWMLRALFFFWYTFCSPRDYDAIVEFEESRPWFVPAFSVKPTLIIKGDRPARRSVYRRLYRRSSEIALATDPESVIGMAIALLETHSHPAVFVHDARTRMLWYRNDCGDLEQLVLR